MAQICGVCKSPKRKQIEAAICAEGASKAKIARTSGIGRASVAHHMANCMPAKVAAVYKEEGVTLATRTKEMARRVGEVFAKLDEAKEGPPCPTCGATAFTTAQALESGFLDMKLKAAVTLGKVAELEFGTKSKVEVSESVRKLTPEQVAAELRSALEEIERRGGEK